MKKIIDPDTVAVSLIENDIPCRSISGNNNGKKFLAAIEPYQETYKGEMSEYESNIKYIHKVLSIIDVHDIEEIEIFIDILQHITEIGKVSEASFLKKENYTLDANFVSIGSVIRRYYVNEEEREELSGIVLTFDERACQHSRYSHLISEFGAQEIGEYFHVEIPLGCIHTLKIKEDFM
ncbi:MAG: hypothetical protein MRY57_03575 [Candidatus Pacebacteria bacterium]|nr:hypothetical protein [Candidatus Paceibacterota bacterium]